WKGGTPITGTMQSEGYQMWSANGDPGPLQTSSGLDPARFADLTFPRTVTNDNTFGYSAMLESVFRVATDLRTPNVRTAYYGRHAESQAWTLSGAHGSSVDPYYV